MTLSCHSADEDYFYDYRVDQWLGAFDVVDDKSHL